MTSTKPEIDSDADPVAVDLFGDCVFVVGAEYQGHPKVGNARGVRIDDADGHIVGVFAPDEARRLADAIFRESNHMAARNAVDQAIADGRLVRLPGGSLIETDATSLTLWATPKTSGTIVTYTPREAGDTLKRLRTDVVGGRARYVPNLTPPGPDPWPVSDHSVVCAEAWATSTTDASVEALEAALAELPGATEHGLFRAHDADIPKGVRPYAWVLLPGDRSHCDHMRERWTRA
jgi:hypothetical protein